MTDIVKDLIIGELDAAVKQVQKEGGLPVPVISEVTVERPQKPDNGDFASSLPLKLAREVHGNPINIAKTIAEAVSKSSEIGDVWVAPPGFINFRLDDEWLKSQVDTILNSGRKYGSLKIGNGIKVMVEFVSINPTGPLHHGHAWGAVIGSALVKVLKYAGYSVTAEYYVNDAGTQMDLFYRSLYARYLQGMGHQVEVPTEGYRGDYLVDTAKEIISEYDDKFVNVPQEDAVASIGSIGLNKMIDLISRELTRLNVEFDVWFREQELHESGEYDEVLELLRNGNYLTERDGAVWFASTALGDDKDNVIIRSSGFPTYFASDIAYHHNKFLKRGFERVINICGSDHQGHISRMKAAVSALGIDSDRLQFLVTQMVSLKRGTEAVKASKRTGEFITLRELMDDVGVDACRYFFLARAPESQMAFDLELAKKESSENPVYYVQYAHARISGILRNAQAQGIDWEGGDVSLLKDSNELALIRKMVYFPELIQSVADDLHPHRIPHYALELANAFHWFYENCRVISSIQGDEEITIARLKLVASAKIVLHNTLDLMNVNAPERM